VGGAFQRPAPENAAEIAQRNASRKKCRFTGYLPSLNTLGVRERRGGKTEWFGRPPRRRPLETEIIMSSNAVIGGPVAVLKLPRSNPAILLYLKALHDAVAANAATFTTPVPTLAAFASDIASFEASEVVAGTRGKGTAKARNAPKRAALLDARHICGYVQTVADAQANAVLAASVIGSAGLAVKTVGAINKPPLAARNGSLAGTATLVAKAIGAETTYFWQYSLDQKTWTSAPETMKAGAAISGLTSGTTYYFRFRALTRKGPVDYSQIVSLLVH
jgi:hypothetical protein